MKRYVLDTDMLSLYQDAHPKVRPAVLAFAPGIVGVTAISVEEQFLGWHTAARQAKRADRIQFAYEGLATAASSLAHFAVLPYTAAVYHRFVALRRLLPRLGGNDLRIAAISLELGATVVTRNTKDFSQVPGLAIVDWSV